MKSFSLIVPCYNVEKYIKYFLQSVFRNQYEKFELILVNDGSIDTTEKEIGKFFNKNVGGSTFQYKTASVIYVYQDNHGVSSARNTGLQYVHNEYIVFADPDDTISPKYFETLNAILSDDDKDILIFGFQKIKENSEGIVVEQKDRLPRNLYNCMSKDEIIEGYLPNILGYSKEHLAKCKKNGCLNPNFEWGAIWRCCYRSEMVLSNSIKFNTEISLNEDSVFNYWCCVYANSLRACDDVLYNYYMRETGALNQLKKTVAFSNKIKITEERHNVISTLQQLGFNITDEAVYGSCILSVIELMIKSKPLNYAEMKKYINLPIVKDSILSAPMTGKIQYDVLFALLRRGLWKPMYFVLNTIGKVVHI